MLNEIINDDCFNVLPNIKDKSIDVIITDPPYNISKKSNFKKSSDKVRFTKMTHDFGDWDTDIDLDKLFQEYKRILKSGGTLIMFYDIWKCNLLKETAERYGFTQPRVCLWLKKNPVPLNSKNNYLSNASEYFFTFTKGKKPTFNSSYDKGIYEYSLCHEKGRFHPTQKPLPLIIDIVEKHSNIGDVVLDTFSGSGTIGVACIETDRKYILIEKNENYYNLSVERINKTMNK